MANDPQKKVFTNVYLPDRQKLIDRKKRLFVTVETAKVGDPLTKYCGRLGPFPVDEHGEIDKSRVVHGVSTKKIGGRHRVQVLGEVDFNEPGYTAADGLILKASVSPSLPSLESKPGD